MPVTITNLAFLKASPDPSLGHSGAYTTISSVDPLHNLFDRISPEQANDGYTDYRLLAIHNNASDGEFDGLKIYVSAETTSPNTKIYLGREPDSFYLGSWPTKLTNKETPPAGIIFTDAYDLATSLYIGKLLSTKLVGIWLKRVVLPGADALLSDLGTLTVTDRIV